MLLKITLTTQLRLKTLFYSMYLENYYVRDFYFFFLSILFKISRSMFKLKFRLGDTERDPRYYTIVIDVRHVSLVFRSFLATFGKSLYQFIVIIFFSDRLEANFVFHFHFFFSFPRRVINSK